MNEFKIKVARIEAVTRDAKGGQVRITFQVERGPSIFHVPILLKMRDFDDTEMVQVARNALHQMFVELSAQTEKWQLTVDDLRQLSSISSRPNP